MGLLRLFLALAVVNGHFGLVDRRFFISPGEAVDCFFVISGFYMSLVLTQRYQSRLRDFYLNRVLRIWPAYLAVLAFSAAAGAYTGLVLGRSTSPTLHWISLGPFLSDGALFFLVFSQLLLLGQDWGPFLEMGPQGLQGQLRHDFSNGAMANFMLIPQAWSLGIEEAFYLISPFYVRLSSGLLAALFLAGLAFVHWAPLTGAMVLARSFPLSCFTVFAGGILAFRLAERWKAAAGDERFRRWAPWAVAALALSLALIPWSAWSPELRRVLLLAILIPCLPFLMVLSEGAAWDRFLGGYSYPLYVGHLLASTLAIVFGPEAENPWVWSLLALLITLALRHGVEKPLEPLRRRLREGLRRGA